MLFITVCLNGNLKEKTSCLLDDKVEFMLMVQEFEKVKILLDGN